MRGLKEWWPQRSAARNKTLRLGAILLLIIGISTLHYRTSTDALYLHEIYQRIYYIPILLAAFWYGPAGGVAAATLTCGIYGYHIHMDWQGSPAYSINQYAEIVLYYAVGLITGFLAMRERRQHHQLERASEDLARAYEKIRLTSEQLRRAERLAALGELTAGIAHEIRNPLGSIKGAVEILHRGIEPVHPKREFLDIIRDEIRRLETVVTQFLGFARPPQPRFQSCSLHDVVDYTVALLKERSDNVSIQVDQGEELPPLQLDPDQFKQILLNVMLNGIQAMPDGGKLTVRTGLGEGGESVIIEVSDQGSGIEADDLKRAFDPFYTTKSSGMGLGLSLSSRLIENHGGQISLDRNQAGGVTCRIELPLTPHSVETGDQVELDRRKG